MDGIGMGVPYNGHPKIYEKQLNCMAGHPRSNHLSNFSGGWE